MDRAHGHSRNIILLRKFRRPRAPLQVHWSGFKLSPWKAFYFYSRGSDGPLFGYTSSWDIEPHAGPSANPLILYLGMWTIWFLHFTRHVYRYASLSIVDKRGTKTQYVYIVRRLGILSYLDCIVSKSIVRWSLCQHWACLRAQYSSPALQFAP